MQRPGPVATVHPPGSVTPGSLDRLAYAGPASTSAAGLRAPQRRVGLRRGDRRARDSFASTAPPRYGAPGPHVITARSPQRPYTTAPAYDSDYRLDAGDKLRIVVYGQDGLTNSYAVGAGGAITMPLIGMVPARGLTPSELASRIGHRLRNGYIREPYVAAEIEAYRPFFILGEVAAPGQYPYVPNMTVESAVAIAGGFTPRARRDRVTLTTPPAPAPCAPWSRPPPRSIRATPSSSANAGSEFHRKRKRALPPALGQIPVAFPSR